MLEQPSKFDRHALLLTYPRHLTLLGGQALLLSAPLTLLSPQLAHTTLGTEEHGRKQP